MRIGPRYHQKDVVKFLAARYDEAVKQAHQSGDLLVNFGAPYTGVSKEHAERGARIDIQRAELLQRFLNETVTPYLGRDCGSSPGPTATTTATRTSGRRRRPARNSLGQSGRRHHQGEA